MPPEVTGDESPPNQAFVDWLNCGPHTIFLEVDVDRLTVRQSGAVEQKQLARFPSFDALCAGYPAVWQAVVDEYGDGDARDETYNEAVPMDVHAAWMRRERRASARAAHDDGVWERKLVKARAALAGFRGQKAAQAAVPARFGMHFDFSGPALASTLTYVIEIERSPSRIPTTAVRPRGKGRASKGKPRDAGNAAKLPIGVSKIGGWPHLPPELAWPTVDDEPLYLFAQLSLAEIAAADVSRVVPARGMLYLFITEEAHGTLVHSEATNLQPREPPSDDIPDYMRKLVDNEQRLTFTPAFYFRQETGDTMAPRILLEALPASLREEVAGILGCSAKPCDAFGGDRIFGGDPVDWQAMCASYLKNELFAQLEYAEGHISIGVDPDDLRIGHFEDADCGYCGT